MIMATGALQRRVDGRGEWQTITGAVIRSVRRVETQSERPDVKRNRPDRTLILNFEGKKRPA